MVLENLIKAGFQNHLPQAPQRLITKIGGQEKTGKSHLALTGPEPVIYHSIDMGIEGVIERFQNTGKAIYVKDIVYQKGEPQSVYEDMWATFLADFRLSLSIGEGTVVVDTWTEIYELVRLAKFGRLDQVLPQHYGPVYAALREMIRDIYDTKMSAALLVKMSPDYNTKELTERGFGDTDFLVQTNIRTSRSIGPDGHPVFQLHVKDSRLNTMRMTGLTLSNADVGDDGNQVDNFNLQTLVWLTHNWV